LVLRNGHGLSYTKDLPDGTGTVLYTLYGISIIGLLTVSPPCLFPIKGGKKKSAGGGGVGDWGAVIFIFLRE
jgi:hypothetical protein